MLRQLVGNLESAVSEITRPLSNGKRGDNPKGEDVLQALNARAWRGFIARCQKEGCIRGVKRYTSGQLFASGSKSQTTSLNRVLYERTRLDRLLSGARLLVEP